MLSQTMPTPFSVLYCQRVWYNVASSKKLENQIYISV